MRRVIPSVFDWERLMLDLFAPHRVTGDTLGLMKSFNLRQVKLRSGEQYRDEMEVPLEPLEFGGQRYVSVPEQVPAELTITRAATGSVFELLFRGRLHGPCQRCLEDAVVERNVSAQEYQATNPDASEELRTPYVHDDRLELADWARDALALELPDQILCRPDCAGLCPVCGRNLNVEPHEHEEETADPRWSALAELKDKL
jgi:uncharacterized protein